MERSYDNIIKSIEHLKILHDTFSDEGNFSDEEDFNIYNENYQKLEDIFSMPEVEMHQQLYNQKNRQMILADILEYIFISRGIFFITEGSRTPEAKKEKRGLFIKAILYFVNLLMSYESMTVDDWLRAKYLEKIKLDIPEVGEEALYEDLYNFKGKVGLTQKESDADRKLNRYFDKILPKTAGGLWHELLVFIFLLRKLRIPAKTATYSGNNFTTYTLIQFPC